MQPEFIRTHRSKFIAYKELNAKSQKDLLWNIITFVEANNRAGELKRKHFNSIPEGTEDLEQYNRETLQACTCLREIERIKKIEGERGYPGRTAQELSSGYAIRSYEWAKNLARGVSFE